MIYVIVIWRASTGRAGPGRGSLPAATCPSRSGGSDDHGDRHLPVRFRDLRVGPAERSRRGPGAESNLDTGLAHLPARPGDRQQWKFTYRYPTYGGMETTQLVLPDHTSIAFHVTSLDVIHNFWAYQLGVKADANPAQDNIAFTTTDQWGPSSSAAPSSAAYGTAPCTTRVRSCRRRPSRPGPSPPRNGANTKLLPPFSYTYIPDANGADGGLYPDNVDPYSKIQTYGATAKPTPRLRTS